VPVQVVAGAPPAANQEGIPLQATAIQDPLWIQAEQAERAGSIAEAIRLYDLLAQQKIKTDHDLAMQCYNRSYHLSIGNRVATPTSSQPSRYADAFQPIPTAVNRLTATPVTNGSPYPPVSGRATSQYVYVKENPAPAYAPPPVVNPVTIPSPPPPTQWSGPGTLSRSALRFNGQPLYWFLLNSADKHAWYVTAQPGVLEPYVNRYVNLYGTVAYNRDLRTYLMNVTHVSGP
jgi:hypothetical protein